MSQSAVSKILLEELVGRVEQQKVRQTLCLKRFSLTVWCPDSRSVGSAAFLGAEVRQQAPRKGQRVSVDRQRAARTRAPRSRVQWD